MASFYRAQRCGQGAHTRKIRSKDYRRAKRLAAKIGKRNRRKGPK